MEENADDALSGILTLILIVPADDADAHFLDDFCCCC